MHVRVEEETRGDVGAPPHHDDVDKELTLQREDNTRFKPVLHAHVHKSVNHCAVKDDERIINLRKRSRWVGLHTTHGEGRKRGRRESGRSDVETVATMLQFR